MDTNHARTITRPIRLDRGLRMVVWPGVTAREIDRALDAIHERGTRIDTDDELRTAETVDLDYDDQDQPGRGWQIVGMAICAIVGAMVGFVFAGLMF